jgi:hypothetical protein
MDEAMKKRRRTGRLPDTMLVKLPLRVMPYDAGHADGAGSDCLAVALFASEKLPVDLTSHSG